MRGKLGQLRLRRVEHILQDVVLACRILAQRGRRFSFITVIKLILQKQTGAGSRRNRVII